ncbi:unnamed protein product [Caretta caretta]
MGGSGFVRLARVAVELASWNQHLAVVGQEAQTLQNQTLEQDLVALTSLAFGADGLRSAGSSCLGSV